MIIQALDDDEMYLAALLDDASGIELAEFCFTDETPGKNDACYRVQPHQWGWWDCEEMYQIDQCSRDIGKSESITARAAAFPFSFPGQEMLLTAPELNHLSPMTSKIEGRFLNGSRLLRAMLPKVKGGGIKHQPQFEMTFTNRAKIIGRLPGRDGKGLKGQHAIRLEMDESQDMPEGAWKEIIETFRRGIKGAQWRAHGVTRGVRDTYFRMTQPDSDVPFYVHRFMAMHRPTWSSAERSEKIAMYGGSRDNLDYKRNILGEHGDASSRLFVLARLMATVARPGTTWGDVYNEEIYTLIKITGEMTENQPIDSMISLPRTHLLEAYTSFWAGADIGFTNDPTEILVFGLVRKTIAGQQIDVLRLLTRLHLMRVTASDQERVVEKVFEFYGDRLRAFSMDKTGVGLPVWQHMQDRPDIRERVKGYGFSEKRAVALDDRAPEGKERPEDVVIEKSIIEFASDKLREYVDSKMIELPYDRDLLTEWQGQTITYVQGAAGSGPRARYSSAGSLHTLDAAKVMILGKELELIEDMQRQQAAEPVVDLFGF